MHSWINLNCLVLVFLPVVWVGWPWGSPQSPLPLISSESVHKPTGNHWVCLLVFCLPMSIVMQVLSALPLFYFTLQSLSTVFLQSESEWCWNTLIFVGTLRKKARGYPSSPRVAFVYYSWTLNPPITFILRGSDYFSPRQRGDLCPGWYNGAINGIEQYSQHSPNTLWQYLLLLLHTHPPGHTEASWAVFILHQLY